MHVQMWATTVLCSDPLHQACSVGGTVLKMRMVGPEMGLCRPRLYVKVCNYSTVGMKGCARQMVLQQAG